jgi:hypothetical protein
MMAARPNGSSRMPAGPPGNTPAAAVDRLSVSLVAKASGDLQRTHDRTRLSKTDIINRAVSLYEFIEAELGAGAELIRRREGQQDQLIKLL